VIVIAHVGGVPVEEIVPTLAGTGTGLLVARAWLLLRLRRRRAPGNCDAIVSVGVTFVTEPRPVQELDGLVYGMAKTEEPGRADRGWYRSPAIVGFTVLAMTAVISLLLI
jgi:hypothetical protein